MGKVDFNLAIHNILDYNNTTHKVNLPNYFRNCFEVFYRYVFVNPNMRFGCILLISFYITLIIQTLCLRNRKFTPHERTTRKWQWQGHSTLGLALFVTGTLVIWLAYNSVRHISGINNLLIMLCLSMFLQVTLKKNVYAGAFIYGIVWVGVSIAYALLHFKDGILDNLLTIDIITYIACLCPLALLLPVEHNRIRNKWFMLIGMISLIQTGLVCYTSGGYWYQGRHSLFGAALFVALMISSILTKENLNILTQRYFTKKVIAAAVIILMSLGLLMGEYVDVYGDSNLKDCNVMISKGPGKWLCTSEEKAYLSENIVDDMRKYSIPGGNLLVLEVFPYAYGVLPEMHIFTQNTWAATLYILGSYTDDIYKAPVFDFFAHKGDEPDMIFYYGKANFIENPDLQYKMHEFILENYIPVLRNNNYTIFHKKNFEQ